MNAAFLLMSSAALAGADVAPPAAAPRRWSSTAGPVATTARRRRATSCGCETKKIGLFDKLKGKFGGFGKKSSSDCGCVPACAPVYVPPPAPCNTCNTCSTGKADRPNLFDKLKSRLGHKKGSSCGPVCDPCGAAHLTPGCATPGAPVVVPPMTGTIPPKEMPKDPKEKPKDPIKPKGDTVVPLPLPPVSGAGGLTGKTSPY